MIKFLIEYKDELHELVNHGKAVSCRGCSIQKVCKELNGEALCNMPTRYPPFCNYQKIENNGNTDRTRIKKIEDS